MDVYQTDRASLERDCDMEFFIASGPGGQHRNKVETGVRLTHRPSGIVVTATERRSQSDNREMAYERMAERLQLLGARLQIVRAAVLPALPRFAAALALAGGRLAAASPEFGHFGQFGRRPSPRCICADARLIVPNG